MSNNLITKNNGFTLVEMLVVMVLLGLITNILFQGLNLIGKVQQRLIPKIQKQQQTLLQEQWFRETISGLMAGVNDREDFIGTRSGFSGISVNPLHSPYSSPAVIHWTITSNNENQLLSYLQTENISWEIQSFPLTQDTIEFMYLDQDGNWLQNWNIKGSDINQLSLPEAIALKSYYEGKEQWWFASVEGEKQASWWLIDEE